MTTRRLKITDIKRCACPKRIGDVKPREMPETNYDTTEEELPKISSVTIGQYNNYILSNYFPYTKTSTRTLDLLYKKKIYASTEALYQVLKYLHKTEDEKEWREIIRQMKTPDMARHLGCMLIKKRSEKQKELTSLVLEYQRKGIRSHIKEENNYDADFSFRRKIMKRVLLIKLEQHESFREALEATDKKKIMSDCPSTDRELMCEVLEEIRNELVS